MTQVSEVIGYVEGLSGHSLNRDEGVHWGSADTEVRHVVVCWMGTKGALTHAAELGADLVLAHESLYYPYGSLPSGGEPEPWLSWLVNVQRTGLLEKHGVTFLRVHGSLDQICIHDDFAALLGLPPACEANGLAKVYAIEPTPFSELVAEVKRQVGMDHVRASFPEDPERVASRVGLPWGGLGLFVNVGYQQQLLELSCDAFIAGETDDCGFRFSAECGVPMIETSHEVSENPGLRHFAEMLDEAFPGLQVSFYENSCPWRTA